MEIGSNGSEKQDSNQLYIQHPKLEATTDRDGSSEEDHLDSHDESSEVQSQSLNLIPLANPSTAAINDSSRNPGYYSDYLKRLPRQEQQRIQREIQKGYKPALTVNNIIEAIQGLDWRKFGTTLYIPDSKLDEISQEYVTDKQRETAVVRYWLLWDPLASWRRIIHELYLDDEEERADRIRHYAEELTDTSLTQNNVGTVVDTVEVELLQNCLEAQTCGDDKTRELCDGLEQQRSQLVHYWKSVSPYASWTYLAGELYYCGREESALAAAKRYFQRAPEPTLTLDNLTSVLEDIADSDIMDIEKVGYFLQIPRSKQDEIDEQYEYMSEYGAILWHKLTQNLRARWDYWLTHHPAPSWNLAAIALWNAGKHETLEMLQKTYLKVICVPYLQELCRSVILSALKDEVEIKALPLPSRLKDYLSEGEDLRYSIWHSF